MSYKPLQAKDILAALESKQAALPLERILEIEEAVEAALMVVPTDGYKAKRPKTKAEGDLIRKHLEKGGFDVSSDNGYLCVMLPEKIVRDPVAYRVLNFLFEHAGPGGTTILLMLLWGLFLGGLGICIDMLR